MTGDWTHGYVADIEYLPDFYREQAPAFLDLACLIRGVQPPDRSGDWTYCDLGCGQGMTCLLLAAANPRGRFFGIDFNPAHIARARELARMAGLDNVTFLEASFEDLAAAPDRLPEFDYVAMHGIYSWVGTGSRQAIVSLLNDRMAPGGVAYVSYNAMPGWNSVVPYQRLILEHVRLGSQSSDRAIGAALAFAGRMAEIGAPGLGDPEVLARMRKELESGNVRYLAHEYLNDHWQPLYHADVARSLAGAKLSFVANGTLLDNFPELSLTPQKLALMDEITDPAARETLRDYLGTRTFRRDVFIRGPRRLDPKRRDDLLRRTTLALTVGLQSVRHEVAVPLGKAELEPGLYGPVLAALAEGPRSIGDLLSLPDIRAKEPPKPVEVVGMLVGSRQALPLDHPEASDAQLGCRAHNRMLIDHVEFGPGMSAKALASPRAGTGLHLQLFELFACGALMDGVPATPEALIDHVWARFQRSGDRLHREGRMIEDEAETRGILRPQMETILREAVPVWRRLALIPD